MAAYTTEGFRCGTITLDNGVVLERHSGSWTEEDAIPERSPWYRAETGWAYADAVTEGAPLPWSAVWE